jgi:hypothetical protein
MIEILKYLLNIINIPNATIIIVNVAYYTVHIKNTGSPSTHIYPAILFFLKHQPNFISLDASTHQPEVTKDGGFPQGG